MLSCVGSKRFFYDFISLDKKRSSISISIFFLQGLVKQRNFGEIKLKACATEKLAREQLRKHGVEHYWDLAFSKSILDLPDDK